MIFLKETALTILHPVVIQAIHPFDHTQVTSAATIDTQGAVVDMRKHLSWCRQQRRHNRNKRRMVRYNSYFLFVVIFNMFKRFQKDHCNL